MGLQCGMDINVMTGVTRELPIHAAAASGDRQFLAFLVGKGADIHQWDARGNSFIHFAAVFINEEAVKFALEHNADIN